MKCVAFAVVLPTFLSVLPTLAAPRRSLVVPRTLTYDPSNPPTLFTDLTCALSAYLTAGEPLSFEYPLADQLGTLITPALRATIGVSKPSLFQTLLPTKY